MLKKIEKLMSAVLILGVLCLIAHNISMNVSETQTTSNIPDGDVFYSESHYYTQPHEIRLSINSSDKYEILVNGEPAETKRSYEGYDILTVYEGDVVSIDLRDCEREVGVFVAYVDEGISVPHPGTKMFVNGGIKELFTVEATREN